MLTFDHAVDRMAQMKETCSSIKSFEFPEAIAKNYLSAVTMYENGRENEGIAGIVSPADGLKTILTVFLRNSVIEKRQSASGTTSQPYFVRAIADREQRNYEPETIDRLKGEVEKFKRILEQETNGSFSRQIAAYNSLRDALEAADREHEKIEASRAEEKRRQEEARRLEAQNRRRQQAQRARALFA